MVRYKYSKLLVQVEIQVLLHVCTGARMAKLLANVPCSTYVLYLISRIDEIEDDILRQKLKIQKVAMELDDTFDDMMTKY